MNKIFAKEIIDKPTYGSVTMAQLLAEENEKNSIDSIVLIGLCTDICEHTQSADDFLGISMQYVLYRVLDRGLNSL